MGPLAFYTVTLMPGVAFWDIGEMQTVPYVLGIPHPTGFPVFVLAGWLFSHLLPIGAPAWRLSLFCGIAVAASAWLLWAFVRDVSGSALCALAAAFVFSLGDIVWTHAVRAEVHDVALAFGAFALVAAQRAGERRDARALALAAAAEGLALATHPVALFTLPAIAILAWPAIRAAPASARVRALGLGLLPLAAYAYIPLRSAYVEAHGLDPGIDLGLHGSAIFDDGSPSSLGHFLRYVSGAAFAPGATAAASFTATGFGRIASYWSDVAGRELGIVAGVFTLAGFALLLAQRRRIGVALAVFVLCNLAFAPNYRVEVDSDRYALLVLWVAVACAAYGAHAILAAIVRQTSPWASVLAAATLAATLLGIAPRGYAAMSAARAFEDAGDIGPEIARHSEDGSLIVATWNFATPLIYERTVTSDLGSRRIVCGWPPDYAALLPGWIARFHHVYYVVAAKYDVTPLGHTKFAKGRWQIATPR